MLPALSLTNRQRTVSFDSGFILRLVTLALPACREALRSPSEPLAGLEAIETTLVSDRQIARVHGQFFDDPTPTDVITFHHGEILIGAGVVAGNAQRFGHTPDEEAALCFVHGLLHLAGWEDGTPAAAKEMARMQEQIFKQVRPMV